MLRNRTWSITLSQMTVCQALELLSRLPIHYQRYVPKNSKSIYCCRFIRKKQNRITLQMIDRLFEPPRGSKSDAPFLHITVSPDGDDVRLDFRYQWQRWKVVLVVLFCVLAITVEIASIAYSFQNVTKGIYLLGIWTPILIGLGVWAMKNYKHDDMTITTFKLLFNSYCIKQQIIANW